VAIDDLLFSRPLRPSLLRPRSSGVRIRRNFTTSGPRCTVTAVSHTRKHHPCRPAAAQGTVQRSGEVDGIGKHHARTWGPLKIGQEDQGFRRRRRRRWRHCTAAAPCVASHPATAFPRPCVHPNRNFHRTCLTLPPSPRCGAAAFVSEGYRDSGSLN